MGETPPMSIEDLEAVEPKEEIAETTAPTPEEKIAELVRVVGELTIENEEQKILVCKLRREIDSQDKIIKAQIVELSELSIKLSDTEEAILTAEAAKAND